MALTLSPSGDQKLVTGLPLCFTGSAIMVIPQEDRRPIDIAASGTNWAYNSTSLEFTKTGGINGTWTTETTTTGAYGRQPFYISGANVVFNTPGSPNINSHCLIGVVDDNDTLYTIEIMKYCGSVSCGAVGGSNWVMTILIGGTPVVSRNVNYNELFYVKSDGVYLSFVHIQGGVEILDYKMPLPETQLWRFIVGAAYIGNTLSLATTYKGTYQGEVPFFWGNSGGTLEDGTITRCFSADTPGTYVVCIDSDYDEPLCVNVEVAALYFNPINYECGTCIFTNQVIEFESNGGYAGTLTVVDEDDNPVGTVIDSLHWQAPGEPIEVTAKYTLDSTTIECAINVIDEFEVLNVDGDIVSGLVPGDTFQLVTNYDVDDGEVLWENLNCANLVSSTGLITIPKDYKNSCFGAFDCEIRAHVLAIPGGGCDNLVYGGDNEITKDLRILVEPTYPTPELGGPGWLKWKPETPDFRVIAKTMEGGCSETYIRNQVPVMRWTVSYDVLKYQADSCGETIPCCDDPLAVFPGGIDPAFADSAKVLDDFWMFVMGEYGYFTLIDPRNGTVWRRVRFDSSMERDHINWHTSHSRTLHLIWNPCCADSPKGGTCVHLTTRTDTLPPSVPQDLALNLIAGRPEPGGDPVVPGTRLDWTASRDNIGVQTYQIEMDFGDDRHTQIIPLADYPPPPVDYSTPTQDFRLVHSQTKALKYIDKVVKNTATSLSIYYYPSDTGLDQFRVRAVDYAGNHSDWSEPILHP